ncbi:MAG TPA: hypothetical protein VKR31_00755 [Rhizomicrobium sp.]|nr:hypothetical protein [Rhizomicrobium sp.]
MGKRTGKPRTKEADRYPPICLPSQRFGEHGFVGIGERNRVSDLLKRDKLGHKAPVGHDGDAPESMDARDFPDVDVDGKREPVKGPMNINCDKIEYLYAHGHIELSQAEAARRLHKDWTTAMILPIASSVLVGAGGANELPNDAKAAAMKRHGLAVEVLGENWSILELVVQQNKSVEQAASMLRVNRKFAMGCLSAALWSLAAHYKREKIALQEWENCRRVKNAA